MKWIKKGLIFCPNSNTNWMVTHAQIPVPIQLNKEILRIFFATRDIKNRTRTAYIDVNIEDPQEILNVSTEPVIELGKPGTHDDSGAMPFSIVTYKDEYYFYYTGWNRSNTVSYILSIGVAISNDLNTFIKLTDGPLISRNINEPYWVAAPNVIIENGLFRMWYISCTDWISINNKLEPVYKIKYMESHDGINWSNNNVTCIDYKFKNEALGRPWVIRDQNIYKMWYSTRGSNNYRLKNGQHYNLGYAESKDGIFWDRMDNDVGITTSKEGWDSEMIEYCSTFRHKNKIYLFYNGNGFGKAGFGYAVLEEE